MTGRESREKSGRESREKSSRENSEKRSRESRERRKGEESRRPGRGRRMTAGLRRGQRLDGRRPETERPAGKAGT